MTARWTLEDRMAFQKLRRILAEIAMAGDTIARVRELRAAHVAATKAVYPSAEAAEVAILRAWMAAVSDYLEADDLTARRGAIAQIASWVGAVADILGPFPTPPPHATPGEAARAWWQDS